MANLSFQEKQILEELFEMKTGYVLNFTNGDFADFIRETVQIDVYNGAGYEEYCSKANKLRQIWNNEPDYVVGALIEELLSYCENLKSFTDTLTAQESKKIAHMRKVADRLKKYSPQIELPNKQDDTLQTLQEDIKNALGRHKPELVLDRLHTFSTKLLRQICVDNGIAIVDEKGNHYSLHSLIGMLRKKYEKDNLFQSTFTLIAIVNSISLFESFNSVRNKQSYAHDNEVLGTLEAEFIVRIMADLLNFIDNAETYRKKSQEKRNL